MDCTQLSGVRDGSLMLCINRNKDSRGRCYKCDEVLLTQLILLLNFAEIFFRLDILLAIAEKAEGL